IEAVIVDVAARGGGGKGHGGNPYSVEGVFKKVAENLARQDNRASGFVQISENARSAFVNA
ncbi:MAG TPA: hypothetical protein DIT58_12210, partial [Porticoccaceae bacterium]|nr:hypothetical protein [Porticoccaceae bacterium]